ncbi:response regulator transcription factor [Actinomycetospora sp. NBRC 106378]|uniref:response regulator n=1 Tax=Actinomycetospora sp. NBRC 106378 TaxID=3032208 RepID=UPI0024A14F8E|nr:response regulator transcription factor [Actinomycetospora sp. NBRC 106378]GLZ56042.1 DNA-binding response regulator [Actinomycetospora sp. NBRC 106378]
MTGVLVVDDHAVVRQGLVALISTVDDLHVVGQASDGEAAVELVAALRPDVVLMDLSMPGTDGATATGRIRAAAPEVRVLVLTSFADQRHVLAALDAGADGYLLKHAEPETILEGLRQVARGEAPLDGRAARVLLSSRSDPPRTVDLTDRESEVLLLVADGLGNKQIARRLAITERTVKNHLTHIYQRLGVTDRTQAALWTERHLRS